MIAVIFEVVPGEGRTQEYLDLARQMRAELEKVDGFISVERFESLYQPGKLLSLQFWRDEESVKRWRTAENHRAMQEYGRSTLFDDYRLRVAAVLRDYGPYDNREQAPDDSRAWHETGAAGATGP